MRGMKKEWPVRDESVHSFSAHSLFEFRPARAGSGFEI